MATNLKAYFRESIKEYLAIIKTKLIGEKHKYIASVGQKEFAINYDVDHIDVFVGGTLQTTGFTATNGTSVIFDNVQDGNEIVLKSTKGGLEANTYDETQVKSDITALQNKVDNLLPQLVTQTLPAGVRDIGVAGKKIDRVVAGGLELTITSGRLTSDAMIEEQFATDQKIKIYYYN